jgi:Protein of unknown function (DUF3592)
VPGSNVQIVMQVLGGGLIAIGAFVAYGTLRTRVKTTTSRRWPTVTGAVIVSEVAARPERNASGRPTKVYRADIQYQYQVSGESFTSETVALGGSIETSSRGRFDAQVARYPVGRKVRVYYDPSDPATAILEPGELGGVFNMMMVALGFLVVGGLFFAAGYFQLGH